jgi:DNA-binding transcriptional LysR family regulator
MPDGARDKRPRPSRLVKRNYTVPSGSLDGIEAFLRVAERRSFREAADDLGVSPSAISQTIRALESRIGVALFVRATRSVGLTQAGERFLERARPAFDELIAAGNAAHELAESPSGLLRIAAPRSVVSLLLQPVLASFAQAFPQVVVEIAASEELVDLAQGGFDAGIRLGEFVAPDMVAVRLTPPLRYATVASPTYLDSRGRPQTLDDLRQHSCIRIRRSGGAIAPWQMKVNGEQRDIEVSGAVVVNDYPTMLEAARGGAGLAQVPAPVAWEDVGAGRLEEVLGDFAPQTAGVFLYHTGHAQVLPKLRAFIDHLKANGVHLTPARSSSASSPAASTAPTSSKTTTGAASSA